MNALSAVSSWLTSQNVLGNYDNLQVQDNSQAQGNKETDSFFNILKLLDTNADGNLGADELKFGAGFMINSMVYGRDGDGDSLLSAKEAGVSQSVISAFDTDNDQNLSAGEIIKPADTIIDGIVSLLDIDGNKLLSNQEMAILELLFSAVPSAGNGDTTTDSGTIDQALDLNTMPDRMRQAGFEGTDNQLYYALASTYADVPWQPDPNDPAAVKLSDDRDKIYQWFDNIVQNVAQKMDADPTLTMTAVVNDGPDKLGGRLGPAVVSKLEKFGDRVQLGSPYEGEA